MTLAWYDPTNKHVSTDKHDPLFTPLGQLWPLDVKREWVGLTDAEAKQVWTQLNYDMSHGKFATYVSRHVIVEFYQAIEAKLKDKNNA
jgi:hypothetical protein